MFVLFPAAIPPVLFALLVWRTDRNREPLPLILVIFGLGMVASLVTIWLERLVMHVTGLSDPYSLLGNTGSIFLLFAVSAPARELTKVAACWPAFRSRHFDEPYDGVVYAMTGALGFAAVDVGHYLYGMPHTALSMLRGLLLIPAHAFFSATWGYALGRVRQNKMPGPLFPATWLGATVVHGLYLFFARTRGPGALIGILPLLLVMGVITTFFMRDLRNRKSFVPESRDSFVMAMARPSLDAAREALVARRESIKWRWVMLGTLVMLGSMVVGLSTSVIVGHRLHIDFSIVDEDDLGSLGPALLLVLGLLAAFPVAAYFVAKASAARTLLEPALSAALSIGFALTLLGVSSPAALAFGIAFAPVAWALACAGAWVGRE